MYWSGDWNVVETNIRYRGACQSGLGYRTVVDGPMAWIAVQHGMPALNSMARERGVELGVAGVGCHIWNVSCEMCMYVADIKWDTTALNTQCIADHTAVT